MSFPRDIILWAVRWYCRYGVSYRDLGKMMTERGVPVDHITIYRWEYHFRASTVLGIVGAGGIGFELMAALRLVRYDQVAAILLVVLACVVVVDALGARLRKAMK